MATNKILWLRAETKPHERRTPLTPSDAEQLIIQKVRVMVERSKKRIFKDNEYASVGCQLVEAGSWKEAPSNAYILGIKELPPSKTPLHHHHIYFAHAYKGQDGAAALLKRFTEGNGMLYDLEFLQDDTGRRVTVFSYWAGVAGCAVTLLLWIQKQKNQTENIPEFFPNEKTLIDTLSHKLADVKHPSSMIIGARGRCGRGVSYLLKKLELSKDCLYKKDSMGRTSYPELLKYDLLFNCVYLRSKTTPFISEKQLGNKRKLSIIADISCDSTSPNNPIPIYDAITTFSQPMVRVSEGDVPLDVMAIDHLPSFLPKESSEDFSNQLLPHLLDLMKKGSSAPVWQRAQGFFQESIDRELS